jgi:phage N-6-adenine-methyltransferase
MDDINNQERWMTPPEVWEPLMEEFNFDLDAFADAQTARLPNYLTDALGPADWPGERIWMNPPYGRKLDPCVRRGYVEAIKGKLVVAIIPMRVRGPWWHEAVIGKAHEVRCVRKRVSFLRPDGTRGKYTGSQDSCIVIWNYLVGSGSTFNFEPGDGSITVNPILPVHTRMIGWEQAA